MTAKKTLLFKVVLIASILCCTGCDRDILDPSQIGRFRPVPVDNFILSSLGVIDEDAKTYAGAEEPRPADVLTLEQDYVFGPGDVVRVSIYELLREGVPYADNFIVTETGRLSIPEIGQVRAAGLTEVKLEDQLKDILYPAKLLDPQVTVTLLSSEGQLFSISGRGISRPSRYEIPRQGLRLLDAIALAGGVGEFNVSYIYINRSLTDQEIASRQTADNGSISKTVSSDEQTDIRLEAVEPDENASPLSEEEEMLEILAPYAKRPTKGLVIHATEMMTIEELEDIAAPEELFEDSSDSASEQDSTGRVEWVFENGKWIPVRVGDGEIKDEFTEDDYTFKSLPVEEPLGEELGLDQVASAGSQKRVIEVDVDKLLGGDPSYNLVIRPGDTITVPFDSIGEFYVYGNVNRTGAIELTGRDITLKQAISLAGGLGPLAWPKKVEVVRRIGRDREMTVMVDLEKIAKGLQPDFFIKKNDWVNVGTHGSSRYLATLRNAFRATYGFGFIYDRNFATEDFGNDPFPGHFSLNNIF